MDNLFNNVFQSLGESTTDEKTKGSGGGAKNKRGNKEKKDKKRREKVQPEEDHVTTAAAESGGEEAVAANILARKEEKRKGKGSATAAAANGGNTGTAGNSGRIEIQEFSQQNVYLVATGTGFVLLWYFLVLSIFWCYLIRSRFLFVKRFLLFSSKYFPSFKK